MIKKLEEIINENFTIINIILMNINMIASFWWVKLREVQQTLNNDYAVIRFYIAVSISEKS